MKNIYCLEQARPFSLLFMEMGHFRNPAARQGHDSGTSPDRRFSDRILKTASCSGRGENRLLFGPARASENRADTLRRIYDNS
jgi:hypothetical protein